MGRRPLPGRRAEICRTAAQVIQPRGFEATSLADIARALGLTKSGLYHYTISKHALLFEIGPDRCRGRGPGAHHRRSGGAAL